MAVIFTLHVLQGWLLIIPHVSLPTELAATAAPPVCARQERVKMIHVDIIGLFYTFTACLHKASHCSTNPVVAQ